MHRSSENVAAIATALAKAQTELSNPEKAMIGTIYNARSDSPQSFRYAYLAGYVRKSSVTPSISLDRVMKSVWLLEQMGRLRLAPRKPEAPTS